MMTDSQFARSFAKMVAFLVVLTVVLITLGVVIGGSIDEKLRAQSEEYTQQVIASRTEPVGKLNVGEVPETMATEAQQSTQMAAVDGDIGKSVYDKACFVCHATGVTGCTLSSSRRCELVRFAARRCRIWRWRNQFL